MNQKVQATGAAGATALVLVFIAGQAGMDVTPEVASAVTVLLAVAAGWLKPETSAATRARSERGLSLVEVLVVLLLVVVALMLAGVIG